MEDETLKIPKQGPVIAIDGPAGTGKSSVTKELARRLGFIHVDTGALYRSIALKTVEQTKGLNAEAFSQAAVEVARGAHLEFRYDEKLTPTNRVWINGEDVTERIRTPEVSLAASRVSSLPEVRAALLALQRQLGCLGPSILEGRDIGTVIFPDADLKFFMTASVDERAKRRLAELEKPVTLEDLKKQIMERDGLDANRTSAPLKQAPDAIVVDTTALSWDEVVRLMEKTAREKLKL